MKLLFITISYKKKKKKIRKLFLVHKFLNMFLKTKMELIMKNYSPLEQAY